MMYLPANLKKYRILKELTQEDVAEFLGITPQSVSKWERGESYPDITLLPALANIFETNLTRICKQFPCKGMFRKKISSSLL